MGLPNVGDRSVSFETVVKGLNLKQRLKLEPSLSEKTHAYHLKVGNDLRMSEVYLIPKSNKKRK